MGDPPPGSRRRRWIRCGGAAVLGLLGVLGARAALLRPEPVEVPPAPDIPAVDAAVVAEHLGAVIRHRTVSSVPGEITSADAFASLHRTLRELYPRTFGTLEVETVDEFGLLLTWPGREHDLDPVLLLAHQDVVPVEPGTQDDWTHAPYGGEIAEGYIWGRGAIDCKLALAGTLDATEALLAQGFSPRRTVILAFGHDEEVGGQRGAAAIARRLEDKKVHPWVVLDEGGVVVEGLVPGVAHPVALVGVAEKGYASLDLVAKGEGGHSTMPPERTSIGRLAQALVALEDNPMEADLRGATRMMVDHLAPHTPWWMRVALANQWLFGSAIAWGMTQDPASAATVRTTTAATMLDSGIKDNVLASEAHAVVNFRILPGESVDGVIEHVREVIDDPSIEVSCRDRCWDPTPISDPESEQFGVLETTIRQIYGDVVVAPYLVVGGTDARYYQPISEAAFRFLAVRMLPEDRARVHGTDERVGVEDMATAVRFYATFITNVAG